MINFFKKLEFSRFLFVALFLSIVFFGILIRVWNLSNIPPGLQYDEAYNGLNALEAVEAGNYKIFYTDNNGREGLYINILALSIKIFGVNVFSIRLISAFFGIFTLIGFYFLLKELKLSKLSTLLGIFLMSTSFWHLNFSHAIYRAIMVPFLLVWLLYFFFLGVRKSNVWYFVVSGLLLGVGFHTYTSFRVVPFILILMLGFLLFYKTDFFQKYWKRVLVFFASTLLVVAPLLWYFYSHKIDLIGSNNAVSIFNAPNMSFLEASTKSTVTHINAFYFYGDSNQQYNQGGSPLIPPAWTVLFTIGLAFSIKEIVLQIIHYKKKKVLDPLFRTSLVAHGIFWIMLIPGILSIEGAPDSLRIIGCIPAVMILIIIPFEYVLRLRENLQKSKNLKLKPWRWKMLNASLVGLVVVVSLAGLMEAYTYYFVWSKEPETLEAFDRKLYDFGKVTKQVVPQKNNILVVPENVSISDDGKDSDYKTTLFAGYPEVNEFKFEHSLDSLQKLLDSSCEGNVYIFYEADEWLLRQFEEQCDNFEITKIKPSDGYYEFWVLKN